MACRRSAVRSRSGPPFKPSSEGFLVSPRRDAAVAALDREAGVARQALGKLERHALAVERPAEAAALGRFGGDVDVAGPLELRAGSRVADLEARRPVARQSPGPALPQIGRFE